MLEAYRPRRTYVQGREYPWSCQGGREGVTPGSFWRGMGVPLGLSGGVLHCPVSGYLARVTPPHPTLVVTGPWVPPPPGHDMAKTSRDRTPPPPPVDRQTGVEILPFRIIWV